MPDLSRTAAYDYSLPSGRIARYPVEERDGSRLLVFPRGPWGPDTANVTTRFQDRHFHELVPLVAEGDLLVINESRVLPVRLLGRKPTGAECEVLLLRPADEDGEAAVSRRWEALVRPGSKLKPGRRVIVSDDLTLVIEDGIPGGGRIVRLDTAVPIHRALELHGRVPLPPYLNRPEGASRSGEISNGLRTRARIPSRHPRPACTLPRSYSVQYRLWEPTSLGSASISGPAPSGP